MSTSPSCSAGRRATRSTSSRSVDWRPGPGGAPVLERLDHWFAGRVLERIDLGDHVGVVLEPLEGEASGGHEAFTFHRAKRIEPGHEP